MVGDYPVEKLRKLQYLKKLDKFGWMLIEYCDCGDLLEGSKIPEEVYDLGHD